MRLSVLSQLMRLALLPVSRLIFSLPRPSCSLTPPPPMHQTSVWPLLILHPQRAFFVPTLSIRFAPAMAILMLYLQ